jgi:hypothetical protein
MSYSELMPLANLVAQKNIHYFVEVNAQNEKGLDAARRLACVPHIHVPNTEYAATLYRHHRAWDPDIYDGDAMSFLRTVLPLLDKPAYIWLDPMSQTFSEELELIQSLAGDIDWYVDLKVVPGEHPEYVTQA